MSSSPERDDLEQRIRELARQVYDQGGLEALQAAEDLLAREAQKFRERAQRSVLSAGLTPDQVHRERYAEIIGNTPALLRVFALMDKVSPSNVPVLIQGESGTGKELVARAIHRNSLRRDKTYVTENCAAIPETLLESELFGYKRGAFTGAEKNKEGLFVVADGGTLFLDEIGDMSLNMQRKLLRVLQDGEIRPVGGNAVVHVDVRLISASNKNLREMVSQGVFREDLFFRLNTITLELPPLRARKEDIPELLNFFLEKVAKEMKMDPPSFTKEAMEAMTRYRWPGNVRELENEVRRCLALKGEGNTVELQDLSDEVRNTV